MEQNLWCQLASSERMACRRLFLELIAIRSANCLGNSIFSFLAMSSRTSTICRKQLTTDWRVFINRSSRVCDLKVSNNHLFIWRREKLDQFADVHKMLQLWGILATKEDFMASSIPLDNPSDIKQCICR